LEQVRTQIPTPLKVNLAIVGNDFELVQSKRAEMWVKGMGLKEGGTVLVRAD
jgi:hypothetical protein